MITLKDLISSDIMTVHTINSKEWEAIQIEMDGCYSIYEKREGDIIHCIITQVMERNVKTPNFPDGRVMNVLNSRPITFMVISLNKNRIRVLLNRRRVMLKLKN